MVRQAEEMVGVECGVCHQEAFQLVKREVKIEVECCPRCAGQVDCEQEEQTIKDAIRAMEKSERKQFLRERSFDWAESLHGKKVEIYWDVNVHQVFSTTKSPHRVRGTAFRYQNASGGYGQVKVVIDPAEYGRLRNICHHTMKCEVTGRDMYFYKPYECDQLKCEHIRPSLDGQRFGLYLAEEEGLGYYAMHSWGLRASIAEV